MTANDTTEPRQESFLNNLAQKMGRPRRSGVTPPPMKRKPYAHLYEGMGQAELVELFIATLGTLRTEVDRVARADFPQALARAVEKFAVQSTLLWDDPRLTRLGAAEWMQGQGLETRVWRTDEESATEADPSAVAQDLRTYAARVDMGITFADLGLAETGSVLLLNGGGRGRVVSLLPPVYLVVLEERHIVPRLTDCVAYIREHMPQGLPSCINVISGPSRTGDIEMDLAFGVHGPGNVHVILLRD
ncbi:MAG TPA: lactate utilization protein C [Bacilli bacterium]|nr:lactate utilization protein C [Bacilli bacterium]